MHGRQLELERLSMIIRLECSMQEWRAGAGVLDFKNQALMLFLLACAQSMLVQTPDTPELARMRMYKAHTHTYARVHSHVAC